MKLVILCCYSQDWVLGVLYANIVVAIIMLGPQWWLQTVIKQVSLIVD